MDISVFMTGALDMPTDNPEVTQRRSPSSKRVAGNVSVLENARQPVLAAIQGGAVGAGVDLSTACDCRYASADAFFCVQEQRSA